MGARLTVRDVNLNFGGVTVLEEVGFDVEPGQILGLVGPNGAGKTTYFNLISGQIRATSGRVELMGRDITGLSPSARTEAGLGRAFQLTNLFPRLTVLENVRLVVQARARRGFNLWSMALSHRDLIAEAEAVLDRVRLTHLAEQTVSALSHGDQHKLEVAAMIALKPRVFMFDEPTAGMSVEEAPVILDLIAGIKADTDATVLLVEHKMDVIRSLADRIIVLHNGALVADGQPAEVMASDVVQEAYLGKELTDV